MPPLPTLAGVTRLQRLLGLASASSAGHLSLFPPTVSGFGSQPFGSGSKGSLLPLPRRSLGTGEEGPGASASPAGHQSSCLFRGRPPKYRKIQQEDFQSKCHPLPWCHCRARLEGLGWGGAGGRSPLAHTGLPQGGACGQLPEVTTDKGHPSLVPGLTKLPQFASGVMAGNL